MLAANDRVNLDTICYPKLISPKIDGVRVMCQEGKVVSRSLKESINPWVRSILSSSIFDGLDGELTVTGEKQNDFNTNQSRFMEQSASKFKFIFWVFDDIGLSNFVANTRKGSIPGTVEDIVTSESFRAFSPYVEVKAVQQELVNSPEEALEYYAKYRELSFEGAILCCPFSVYKHGRSTLNQEIMLKLKPSEDSEAVITGFEEAMHNLDAGNSKRQENLYPAGRAGKVVCAWNGMEIKLGTGFDHNLATDMLANPSKYIGKLAKFKYMELTPTGQPRHAVYLGLRSKDDLS